MPQRKRLAILANIVICGFILSMGGAVFGWFSTFKQQPEQREKIEKIYNVEVYDVEKANLQEILSGFGTAIADREVVISAQVAGEVVEVFPRLEIGEKVEPPTLNLKRNGESELVDGDLLVGIDPQTYTERVQQAQNRLVENQAEAKRIAQEEKNNTGLLDKVKKDYSLAEREYQRVVGLRKQQSVTQSQVVRAELDLNRYQDSVLQYENQKNLFPVLKEQAANRVTTSQTELKLAKIDLERTKIYPSFSGRLSEVMVERGQYVRPGESLVRITDLSEVEIPISLTLDDYAKIDELKKAGVKIPVELASNETAPARWFGYVDRISPVADEKTRTVNVYVQVDNNQQDVPLLPGTFVHARISGPVLKGVNPIPREAINKDGRFFVVGESNLVEERTAVVSEQLQSLAVLESGANAEEQIVLTNLDVIFEGASCSVQSHRTLTDELKQQRVQIVRRVNSEE